MNQELASKIKKLTLVSALLSLFLIIGLIVFIKFDTEAAADFTDNVIRPVIGSKNTVFLEKIFFNASDKVQQITYQEKDLKAPQFNNEHQNNNSGENNLVLTNIPVSFNFKKLASEGVWNIMKLKLFPEGDAIADTYVRPDVARPYSIVTIAQLNMKKMTLGLVAGRKEPGGKIGNPGPGKVPSEIVSRNQLLAAFDGGFQFRDGEYGMIVGDKTYVPLKKDLGTIVGYKNGDLKIIEYTGQDLGKDVIFTRQNCPILIENGQLAVADAKNKKLWGNTTTSDIYTWRTGLGLIKNGNLLFAVGNNLTPTTLAMALKSAGAENAIQLDINPVWVRFNLFNALGNGKYTSTTLTRDLKNGAPQYLNGYSKDFFYVYKKS